MSAERGSFCSKLVELIDDADVEAIITKHHHATGSTVTVGRHKFVYFPKLEQYVLCGTTSHQNMIVINDDKSITMPVYVIVGTHVKYERVPPRIYHRLGVIDRWYEFVPCGPYLRLNRITMHVGDRKVIHELDVDGVTCRKEYSNEFLREQTNIVAGAITRRVLHGAYTHVTDITEYYEYSGFQYRIGDAQHRVKLRRDTVVFRDYTKTGYEENVYSMHQPAKFLHRRVATCTVLDDVTNWVITQHAK